jgi:putative hemolysin
MFTVDQVLKQHYPSLRERHLLFPLLHKFLRKMLHEQAFTDFFEQYPYLHGIEFVEQALEYFNFSFTVSERQRENIPATGRVVIVANHPIGSLDGLALLKLVHDIRSDVKVVANDLLMAVEPLRSCLLPVKNMTGKSSASHINRIWKALDQNQVVIFFPAGEVSRIGSSGIRDGRWRNGFLKMAERTKSPILPIHVGGRNSMKFYLTSLLAKSLSTLMLVGEMFRQERKQIHFTIGSIISYKTYSNVFIQRPKKVKLFKKHLYLIGNGKRPVFKTESSIARPEKKADLKRALQDGDKLGQTPDGNTVYLYQPVGSSPLLREIGRLREATFRAIGEGSGKRRDIDKYDHHYKHLILWDKDDLEIAGAYRIADSAKVLQEKGRSGLYSWSLFNYDESCNYFLQNGLELGRSFVQQRYWGTRCLDYLWHGIGAYLSKNPQYRYLFGPVSISNSMPQLAKDLMIYFYNLYFGKYENQSCSRTPFQYKESLANLEQVFCGDDYKADLKNLKTLLANLGTTIPPLYKQYTELCEPGGLSILGFNIDPDFNNCIDGLMIVDTLRIKPKKRSRYISDFLS